LIGPLFGDPAAAPLTGGARFMRGFTRIGAIIAALVTLIGVSMSILIPINNYDYEVATYKNAQCIARLARGGWTFKKKYEFSSDLDYEVGGCSDRGLYATPIRRVMEIADETAPTFLTANSGASAVGMGLMITGICAIAAYLAFWCIGWVFAGFTRDA
jgi:hypothetical protein